MTAVRKFLFETNFDAPAQPELPDEEEQVVEEAAPQPTYGEDELAEARRDAYEAGRQDGRSQAQEEHARQSEESLSASLKQIGEQLSRLEPEIAASLERTHSDAVRAGILVVQKLFPQLVERQGDQEIRALLESSLTRLMEEPRIVIRVHDSQLDELRGQMEQIKENAGFEGKTVLLAEQDIRPGDIRIEWADGGIERDSERAWQDIGELIEKTLVPAIEDSQAEPSPEITESEPESDVEVIPTPASDTQDVESVSAEERN